MLASAPEAAFSRLRRDLVRRRLASLDLLLRVELVAIAVLIGGFLFWQLRIRYAAMSPPRGLAEGGDGAGVNVMFDLASLLLALAIAGGVAAGLAHARRLRRGGGPGPAWGTLPVSPLLLARHLAWESRGWALLPALAGVPALIAAIGLVPISWLALAAAAEVVLLLEATRIGCAIALWRARRAPQAAPGTPRIVAVLANVSASRAGRRLRPPVWRRSGPSRALFAKDARLLLRDRSTRTRLAMALLLALASFAPWLTLHDAAGAHVIGFALAMLSAASFGEVILALAGTDPFPALRVLPVRGVDAWRARAGWAVLALALLLALQSASAFRLSPGAAHYFLTLLAFATAAVLALAVNYAVTLYPQADQAARLYGLSLGLAVIGSLLIPLLGWIVLISAVIHSTRRLSRWWRLEEHA
jgi:hypothetical protein